ncbi:MAG: hypothetical protein HY023_10645 [Chloroflexi bacterium]|nr:hypothetical protein [Chloroflexota bacterium]
MPTFTPLPRLLPSDQPGEPAYSQDFEDCITGDKFVEGAANQPDPNCDAWEMDLYERPFNAKRQNQYFPDLDIVKASAGQDDIWYYYRIEMFGLRVASPGALTAIYRVELDVDNPNPPDGRGDWLIEVQAPTANLGTDWGQKGLTLWHDNNSDVGDRDPLAPDLPKEHGDGYDLVTFSQGIGDPPNGAFARVDPTDPKAVEIAIWRQLVGHPRTFGWRVSAEEGLPNPSDMYHQDVFTSQEAGSPYKTSPDYPTRKIFETDNMCSWETTGPDAPPPCPIFGLRPGEATPTPRIVVAPPTSTKPPVLPTRTFVFVTVTASQPAPCAKLACDSPRSAVLKTDGTCDCLCSDPIGEQPGTNWIWDPFLCYWRDTSTQAPPKEPRQPGSGGLVLLGESPLYQSLTQGRSQPALPVGPLSGAFTLLGIGVMWLMSRRRHRS